MKFITHIINKISKSSNKKKDHSMQHFSEEYRDKLLNEHKLVAAAIAHLTTTSWNRSARAHGADVTTAAVSNLKAEKVALEAKIDVINEYLS